MRISIALLSCTVLAAVALATPAWALEHLPIQSHRKLLRPRALEPLLERGDVSLIETHSDGGAKQIMILSLVDAPRERVFDVIMDVESYPEFLPSIESAKIIGRTKSVIAYSWELDVPVLSLKGRRETRGRRPHLVETRGLTGNFRGSQDRWELFAVGKRTLVVLYRTIDFRTGGVILSTMVKVEPSMANAMNLAQGFAQMTSLRRHVEGKPKVEFERPSGPVPPFRRMPIEPDSRQMRVLEPLLALGEMALVESNRDGSLKQAVLFAHVAADSKKLRALVSDAGGYAEFIPSFAETRQFEKSGKTYLEYELDIPLVSVEGLTTLSFPEGNVVMEAVSGDVKRARWRWEFLPLPAATLVTHYVYSDVAEASWFLEQVVKRQPLLEHGIVVASSSVGVRAVKEKAEGRR